MKTFVKHFIIVRPIIAFIVIMAMLIIVALTSCDNTEYPGYYTPIRKFKGWRILKKESVAEVYFLHITNDDTILHIRVYAYEASKYSDGDSIK